MARPPEDPRITDLARYKKAREAEQRRKPAKPPRPAFLGSNPRAGLILALVALAILAYLFLPSLLGTLRR